MHVVFQCVAREVPDGFTLCFSAWRAEPSDVPDEFSLCFSARIETCLMNSRCVSVRGELSLKTCLMK